VLTGRDDDGTIVRWSIPCGDATRQGGRFMKSLTFHSRANVTTIARVLQSCGLIGLGIMGLWHRDFALQWQPVPAGIPGRSLLACMSAAVLLTCGLVLWVPRYGRLAAWTAAAFLASWAVALHGPLVLHDPGRVATWLGFAETLVLTTGAVILGYLLRRPKATMKEALAREGRGIRVARTLLAIALPIFGLSHFTYPEFTASMIPAWLPQRLALAYVTGAAHTAAGAGMLFGVMPRPAAALEAAMMGVFVALIHVPGVLSEPTSRVQWTMLFVAVALTGATAAAAATFVGEPDTRRP
jgi:uncharacterized membrane protein